MGAKKPLYVLYSMGKDLMPKMYKTKSSCQKHMKNNPSLKVKEFVTQKQAKQFIKQIASMETSSNHLHANNFNNGKQVLSNFNDKCSTQIGIQNKRILDYGSKTINQFNFDNEAHLLRQNQQNASQFLKQNQGTLTNFWESYEQDIENIVKKSYQNDQTQNDSETVSRSFSVEKNEKDNDLVNFWELYEKEAEEIVNRIQKYQKNSSNSHQQTQPIGKAFAPSFDNGADELRNLLNIYH